MRFFMIFTLFAISLFGANISIIKVDKMHCPLCTTAVKNAIKELDGVLKVSARLNTKEVSVVYDDRVKLDDILNAIKSTSYVGVELVTKKYEE